VENGARFSLAGTNEDVTTLGLNQRSPTDGPRTTDGRERSLVVRGEIWTLFAIFMFIILFHYILMRLRVTDTGSLTIFALLRCSNKYHTNDSVIIKQVHFILIK
jgi:hypothetical protein